VLQLQPALWDRHDAGVARGENECDTPVLEERSGVTEIIRIRKLICRAVRFIGLNQIGIFNIS